MNDSTVLHNQVAIVGQDPLQLDQHGPGQDQRRAERDSSTTASTSSGPMPMASARPRP
jgi:hypothetical protein